MELVRSMLDKDHTLYQIQRPTCINNRFQLLAHCMPDVLSLKLWTGLAQSNCSLRVRASALLVSCTAAISVLFICLVLPVCTNHKQTESHANLVLGFQYC